MADNSSANGDLLNRNNNLSILDCLSDTNSANNQSGMKNDVEMESQISPDKAGDYVRELLHEKQSLDSSQWPNALRLLDQGTILRLFRSLFVFIIRCLELNTVTWTLRTFKVIPSSSLLRRYLAKISNPYTHTSCKHY